MSRRVYLLGVGLALVALALALADWALKPPPGVTEANARRVRRGMSMWQVEALLGKPTRVYTLRRFYEKHYIIDMRYIQLDFRHDRIRDDEVLFFMWDSERYYILVRFEARDLVESVSYDFAQDRGDASFVARLRAWLGW
jgi:hypothetical protein